MRYHRTHHILIAEDDPDDVLMLKEAFLEADINCQLHFVENGEGVFKYLNGEDPFSDREKFPNPSIIMLDLNMPKIDGRETLKILKENDAYKIIPVAIFTTSDAENDISLTYNLGVNCYIKKPDSFLKLKEIVNDLNEYWFRIAKIPYKP